MYTLTLKLSAGKLRNEYRGNSNISPELWYDIWLKIARGNK